MQLEQALVNPVSLAVLGVGGGLCKDRSSGIFIHFFFIAGTVWHTQGFIHSTEVS